MVDPTPIKQVETAAQAEVTTLTAKVVAFAKANKVSAIAAVGGFAVAKFGIVSAIVAAFGKLI